MNNIINKKQQEQKKKKKTSSQQFKNSYFDFYDDIKTNPRQDW